MDNWTSLRLCTLISITVVLLPVLAKADLRGGPGKDLTVKLCGKCHSPEQAVSLHQSRDDWEETISKMVEMGFECTDDQFNTILGYLAKNYGPEAPRPVNVNKATTVELESSLAVLKSEAAAIVKYRLEKGDFKSIDDLRNVPGLDFKKIEAKKSRLVF